MWFIKKNKEKLILHAYQVYIKLETRLNSLDKLNTRTDLLAKVVEKTNEARVALVKATIDYYKDK